MLRQLTLHPDVRQELAFLVIDSYVAKSWLDSLPSASHPPHFTQEVLLDLLRNGYLTCYGNNEKMGKWWMFNLDHATRFPKVEVTISLATWWKGLSHLVQVVKFEMILGILFK